MSQPLYFLPNLQRQQIAPDGRFSRAILKERGIDDVFSDVVGQQDCLIGEVMGPGPGGQTGTILCYQRAVDGRLPSRTGYQPEFQTWTPIHSESLWIGINNDEPITEEDIRRQRLHPGWESILREGEAWIVPVVRRPDGSSELPTEMYFDAAGNLCRPIKDRYQEFWQESAKTCALFAAGDTAIEEVLPIETRLHLAIRALGINYRFGRTEQSIMRLIDSENHLFILYNTIDRRKVDAVREAEKKTELASSPAQPNSTPGQPEG
jgi:hypothetical protein